MKILKNRPAAAELGLVFITILWGSSFVVVKDTTETVSTAYMIAIRFGIAAIFLFGFFWKRLKKITPKYLEWGLFLGLQDFAAFEFQTEGIKYTTAGKNAFLTAVYCVIVPFLYWAVRKKRPSPVQISSAFLCIVGVGMLSLQEGFSMNVGDLLSLTGGFVFAVQIITISILTEKYDPILLCVLQTATTAAFALPLAIATEPVPLGLPFSSVASLLYLAVFITMLTTVLQTVCQKYTPPAKASLIMSLESVFGSICGIIFLHEPLTIKIFSGFVLIFTSILLSERNPQLSRRKKVSGSASALSEVKRVE